MKKQKGFTLIELLVVIAIIGLLASIVLVSLNGARKKARMAKRAADLSQVSKALELYYSDNNAYPVSGGGYRSVCPTWGGPPTVTATNTIPSMVPTYMSSEPQDPSMNASLNQNCYLYYSNGTYYKFLDYNLTDMTLADINTQPNLKDPCRNDYGGSSPCGFADTNLTWAVWSPGITGW